MHEKPHKTRDPVERLDEIVAELDRLYAEADYILDVYELGQSGWCPAPKVLKCH
jgi:hypothetical protein